MPKSLFALLLALTGMAATGQVVIKGTVYDRSQNYAMSGVSVMGTSGAGTMTDSAGHYRIKLSANDSLYFSYLGKGTAKVPVKSLDADLDFDMSLEVDADTMASVLVWSRNYRQDSLLNRLEYQKVFDYEKGMVNNMKTGRRGTGLGVGLDFDMILNPSAGRRILALQKRLEYEEKDNYVDHRFNPGIVRKVTGLESPALDTFMREYRPNYEFLQTFETDYDFYKFIAESAKYFEINWNRDHPNDHVHSN